MQHRTIAMLWIICIGVLAMPAGHARTGCATAGAYSGTFGGDVQGKITLLVSAGDGSVKGERTAGSHSPATSWCRRR